MKGYRGKDMVVCDSCKQIDVPASSHVMSLKKIQPDRSLVPIINNYDGLKRRDGHIDLCETCSNRLASAMLALLVKAEK